MQKSKSMTIAMIVMGVILAVSLAATVTLAAFYAQKTATTTIKFDNGVTLLITGATNAGEADVASTAATLNWTVTGATTEDNGANYNAGAGDSTITLSAIDITATGTNAFVAVKPVITYTGGTGTTDTTLTLGANWKQVGSTGWYVYSTKSVSAAADATQFPAEKTNFSAAKVLYTAGDDANANNFAGRTFTCTITFVAASDTTKLAALMA